MIWHTLQHTATHCSTLQHTAAQRKTQQLQHTATQGGCEILALLWLQPRVCCSVLQCVAKCGSVLNVLQCAISSCPRVAGRQVLAQICNMTHFYVPCLVSLCDMLPSYIWYSSLLCVTWLTFMCGLTHFYVWHAWILYVSCLTLTRDMPHCCLWHDSRLCETWLSFMCEDLVTHHILLCDMSHSHIVRFV